MWGLSAIGADAAAAGISARCSQMLPLLMLAAAAAGLPAFSPNYSLPEYLKPCHRSDPELNTCLRGSLNQLLRELAAGIPEHNVPSLDPLHLPFVDLSGEVQGNLTLSLILRDVLLSGFSQTTVLFVRANPAERKFEVTSRLPRLLTTGHFDASGAVLSFPLSGQGSFEVNMTEVSATWILYYREEPLKPGGPDFIFLDDFELDLAPTDVTFRFGDRLDGDNHLGTAFNEFLNTNAHEVFGDVRSRVSALLASGLRNLAEHLLASFPAQRLLPE